jgi:hypothetical protein
MYLPFAEEAMYMLSAGTAVRMVVVVERWVYYGKMGLANYH